MVKTTNQEEAADELGDAGEGGAVVVVLRQAAAEQTQTALPHPRRHRVRRVKELRRLAALQIPDAQRSVRQSARPLTAQRIKHNQHTDHHRQEDDPAEDTHTVF